MYHRGDQQVPFCAFIPIFYVFWQEIMDPLAKI